MIECQSIYMCPSNLQNIASEVTVAERGVIAVLVHSLGSLFRGWALTKKSSYNRVLNDIMYL